MKTIKYLGFILAALFIFIACQKETSLETGFSGAGAVGTLGSVAGQCDSNTEIHGEYVRDSVLNDSNYVIVQLNVANPGIYKIITETENGFSFYDSGYIINTGYQNIRLKSIGRPIAAQNTSFLVTFGESFCSFTIPVSDTPNKKAAFGIDSIAGCGTINGAYKQGTPLNPNTNYIQLLMNVVHVGSYSVSTPIHNGMRFSASGNFASIGRNQTVILRGSGTPIKGYVNPGKDTVILATRYTVANKTYIDTCRYLFPVDTLGSIIPPGGATAADSAWQFSQGSKFNFGPIDSLLDTTYSGLRVLGLGGYNYAGTAKGDTLFGISFKIPTGVPVAGTYNTNNPLDGAAFAFADSANNPIYSALPTIPTVNVTITVVSYNATTKIVIGTFTGTAQNSGGTPVNITGGKFTAKLP